MMGNVPSGCMRRLLLALVLITGVLLIAMFAHAPPLGTLQPFTSRSLREMPRQRVSLIVDEDKIQNPDNDLYEYMEMFPFRVFQSPWSWACVSGRCERRPVRSSKISLSTCHALCGGNTRLLWPRPTGAIELGNDNVIFQWQQIEFVTVNINSKKVIDLLEHAKDIFLGNIRNLIKTPNPNTRPSIQEFVIYISAEDPDFTIDIDESYQLEVVLLKEKRIEVRITAKSYYGARHGLETLSQTIWWDENCGRQGCLRALSRVFISDKPIFSYRGLLVDTGRQFFEVEQLKRVIDGMAASKMNVFHWHLTDSQSFPFDSMQYPEMARWGAYSGEEIYTPQDIKELSFYAKVRGIRLIIEIDSPAHAGAGWQWGAERGLGELALCIDQQPWSSYCGEPNCGQLNPINENAYTIMEGLYREVLELTEVRDIIHLGGDEVNLDCWAQYSNITLSMQSRNLTDYHALWAEFERRLEKRVIKANQNQIPKAIILWSSALTKRPYLTAFDPSLHVIQVWGASNWLDTAEILEDGFRVILSHVDAWYLDCGFGRWRENGEGACGEYRTWQTVYNHRPWRDYLPQHIPLILGGEAAIWSEQLGQASLGPRLWPRASALGERLWSDLPSNGYSIEENVYTRLSGHIELLQSRGIQTEAMWPRWCTQNPGKCL